MPLFKKKKIGAETTLGVWKCTESLESLLNLVSLDNEDLAKLNSFVNEKRKIHFLTTRLLCKEIINSTKILYNEDGKPFKQIVNKHISISHSHDFVAVIIGNSPFIGLDVQRIEEKITRIRDRFVNETEKEQFDYDDITILTLIWCVKESLYKIHGDRNVFFKEHMTIPNLPKAGMTRFKSELNHPLYYGIHNMEWEKLENYILVYTAFDS